MIARSSSTQIELVAIMTLVVVLLHGSSVDYVQVLVVGTGITGLLLHNLRVRSAFWFALAALLAGGVVSQWYRVDNHKYLLVYWCLALSVSLYASEPETVLRLSARWLIGLTFLCAVVWKLASPDYLDGDFFEYSLLLDRRFTPLAEGLGGMVPMVEDFNRAAQSALIAFDSRVASVELHSTIGVRYLALALTWWSLLLETLIATAFLLPGERGLAGRRDHLLLLFVVSTYAVASVVGFGWLLVIMGLAQETGRSPFTRLAYLGCFVLLQLYRFPWIWAVSLVGG